MALLAFSLNAHAGPRNPYLGNQQDIEFYLYSTDEEFREKYKDPENNVGKSREAYFKSLDPRKGRDKKTIAGILAALRKYQTEGNPKKLDTITSYRGFDAAMDFIVRAAPEIATRIDSDTVDEIARIAHESPAHGTRSQALFALEGIAQANEAHRPTLMATIETTISDPSLQRDGDLSASLQVLRRAKEKLTPGQISHLGHISRNHPVRDFREWATEAMTKDGIDNIVFRELITKPTSEWGEASLETLKALSKIGPTNPLFRRIGTSFGENVLPVFEEVFKAGPGSTYPTPKPDKIERWLEAAKIIRAHGNPTYQWEELVRLIDIADYYRSRPEKDGAKLLAAIGEEIEAMTPLTKGPSLSQVESLLDGKLSGKETARNEQLRNIFYRVENANERVQQIADAGPGELSDRNMDQLKRWIWALSELPGDAQFDWDTLVKLQEVTQFFAFRPWNQEGMKLAAKADSLFPSMALRTQLPTPEEVTETLYIRNKGSVRSVTELNMLNRLAQIRPQEIETLMSQIPDKAKSGPRVAWRIFSACALEALAPRSRSAGTR